MDGFRLRKLDDPVEPAGYKCSAGISNGHGSRLGHVGCVNRRPCHRVFRTFDNMRSARHPVDDEIDSGFRGYADDPEPRQRFNRQGGRGAGRASGIVLSHHGNGSGSKLIERWDYCQHAIGSTAAESEIGGRDQRWVI